MSNNQIDLLPTLPTTTAKGTKAKAAAPKGKLAPKVKAFDPTVANVVTKNGRIEVTFPGFPGDDYTGSLKLVGRFKYDRDDRVWYADKDSESMIPDVSSMEVANLVVKRFNENIDRWRKRQAEREAWRAKQEAEEQGTKRQLRRAS
jgi:hypothetical protein